MAMKVINKVLRKRIHPLIAILAIAIPVVAIVLWNMRPGTQWHNLRLVDRWLGENSETIREIERSESVTIESFTGLNGSVWIRAENHKPEEAEPAIRKVLELHPPRPLEVTTRKTSGAGVEDSYQVVEPSGQRHDFRRWLDPGVEPAK